MASEKSRDESFPWHLGVYDAHCHPTDTMSSIETIQNMKARVLTVMATRSEDQDLVLSTANKHSIRSSDPSRWTKEECIVPCFGWHPWFSYQMYISPNPDSGANEDNELQDQGPLTGQAKMSHYQSVLQPFRSDPSEAQGVRSAGSRRPWSPPSGAAGSGSGAKRRCGWRSLPAGR